MLPYPKTNETNLEGNIPIRRAQGYKLRVSTSMPIIRAIHRFLATRKILTLNQHCL